MENIKINDVRLRGCGFTLEPACKVENVKFELLHSLLFLAHNKAVEILALSQSDVDRISELNPDIPTKYSEDSLIKHFTKFFSTNDGWQILNECLSENLLQKNDDIYEFSSKTLEILKKAAEIQNKLDGEGFHHCPCCLF